MPKKTIRKAATDYPIYVFVFVTGGVSLTVVDVVPEAGGVTGSYGAAVPSTPVDGCGGAWPMPWPAGVSAFDFGGSVMFGGAFW